MKYQLQISGTVKTLTVVINESKKYIISRESNFYRLFIMTTVKIHIFSSTIVTTVKIHILSSTLFSQPATTSQSK